MCYMAYDKKGATDKKDAATNLTTPAAEERTSAAAAPPRRAEEHAFAAFLARIRSRTGMVKREETDPVA